MPNPTTRVLAVLELLQTHGLISGAEMARRLEVDPRTLRRYIAMLEELGIPVTAERGRDGGYRLVNGFKLPPMMFSNEEALALALGLRAARGLGLAEAAPAVASARAKLERVMPDKLRRQVRAVDETVALDLSRPHQAGDQAVLATLSAAAQAQQRVHLHYGAPSAPLTERDLDPYGLGYRAGRWYVVGYCHLRQDLRAFRLDRIQRAEPIPASFRRPEDFDILAYLTESIATLPRSHAVEVLLHTDLATARREVFGALGVLEETAAGVLLRGQTDGLLWMARELARLPFRFEILSPDGLREAVREVAVGLLAMAGGPSA